MVRSFTTYYSYSWKNEIISTPLQSYSLTICILLGFRKMLFKYTSIAKSRPKMSSHWEQNIVKEKFLICLPEDRTTTIIYALFEQVQMFDAINTDVFNC